MIQWLLENMRTSVYMPHAICLLEYGPMVWAYAAFHVIIAGSYFWIGYACRAGRQLLLPLNFSWLFLLFIMACGLGHLTHVYTMFSGNYPMEVLIDGLTAGVSVATALLVIPTFVQYVERKAP